MLLNTNSTGYDIIGITETWLRPGQSDSEFMSNKYKTFRKDRALSTIDCDTGGGVLLAIKNEIDCERYETDEMEGVEAVCIKMPVIDSFLYVYCLYIQPSANLQTYRDHLTAIKSIDYSERDSFIILGDWNFSDTIQWIDNDEHAGLIPLIGESECAKAIIAREATSFFMEFGLSQICNLENKKGNVLDLVITNIPDLVKCFCF